MLSLHHSKNHSTMFGFWMCQGEGKQKEMKLLKHIQSLLEIRKKKKKKWCSFWQISISFIFLYQKAQRKRSLAVINSFSFPISLFFSSFMSPHLRFKHSIRVGIKTKITSLTYGHIFSSWTLSQVNCKWPGEALELHTKYWHATSTNYTLMYKETFRYISTIVPRKPTNSIYLTFCRCENTTQEG